MERVSATRSSLPNSILCCSESVPATRPSTTTTASLQPTQPVTHALHFPMASLASITAFAGFTYGRPVSSSPMKPRRMMVVRAEGINPDIRKTEDKVVDSVVVTELQKPLTAYCRCWRSGTFPLCDGSHVKHNKATGDNVGPLLLKKQ